MKTKLFLLSSLVFCILTLSLLAQPGDDPGRMGRMLDLSEEQKVQILDSSLKLKKEIVPISSEIHQLKTQMKVELAAEKLNESQIKKLNNEISKLQAEIQLKRIMHKRTIRDMLTEEQKKKFDLHILSEQRFRDKRAPGFRARHPQPPGPGAGPRMVRP